MIVRKSKKNHMLNKRLKIVSQYQLLFQNSQKPRLRTSRLVLKKLPKEKKLARLMRLHRKKELLGTQPSIVLDMLGQLVVQVMWLFNPKHLSMSAVITEA